MKIGDRLYKRVALAGIFSYVCYEVRRQEKATLYAVRCEQCRDHEPCELLVTKIPKQNAYKYVCMLNEDVDEDYCTSQRQWHEQMDDRDSVYYTTKARAIEWALKNSLDFYEAENKKHEDAIKRNEQKMKEIYLQLEDLDAVETEAGR